MPLSLTINGQSRNFDELSSRSTLQELVEHLQLKSDRIAMEHNGQIAPRDHWNDLRLQPGDKLELVHFVGGGLQAPMSC